MPDPEMSDLAGSEPDPNLLDPDPNRDYCRQREKNYSFCTTIGKAEWRPSEVVELLHPVYTTSSTGTGTGTGTDTDIGTGIGTGTDTGTDTDIGTGTGTGTDTDTDTDTDIGTDTGTDTDTDTGSSTVKLHYNVFLGTIKNSTLYQRYIVTRTLFILYY